MREAESLAKFGSWQINIPDNIIMWSPQIFRILGYEPYQVQPSLDTFIKVVYPDDIDKVKTSLYDAINNYDAVKTNFRINGIDGAIKYCHLEMVTQRNAQFKPTKIVGFIQDVTRVKLAENEIKLLNESLEKKIMERTTELMEANRDLEAFNFSISHDLNNPLQVINGFASIILRKHNDKLNEDAKDLLKQIKGYTKQMGQLIHDLLNFSHLGRQLLEVNEINMYELVNEVIRNLENRYRNVNTKFIIGEIDNAICDGGLIQQVWVNLISNAIKYSSKQDMPIIEIGSKKINEDIVYYVKDNGAGFSIEHADKLFKAFNRLHTAQEFEGSGVGLAIVHRIILKHGGRIWAEASVGNGAAFYFTLPNKVETKIYLNQDKLFIASK
jgi:PAS domain S-box-containing protein